MASVMHLLQPRVRLVEEVLEASVVDAQDVPVDVGGSLATMEVGHFLSTNWSCMANGLHLYGDCYFTRSTDIEPSFSRP